MTITVEYLSRYHQRVKIVNEAVRRHSELSEKASLQLAEHVLEALDHMPEKVR